MSTKESCFLSQRHFFFWDTEGVLAARVPSDGPRRRGRQPHFRGVSQKLAHAQGDGDPVDLWRCRASAMKGEALWGLGDMTVGRAVKLRLAATYLLHNCYIELDGNASEFRCCASKSG